MKKTILMVLVLLFAIPAAALADLSAAWDYDLEAVSRVDRFRLYYSETAGGPYTALLDIEKVEDRTTYTAAIPRDALPDAMVYFVMTAENSAGESGYSNEASADLRTVPAPFNLLIELVDAPETPPPEPADGVN
jgi:hypothetical protein